MQKKSNPKIDEDQATLEHPSHPVPRLRVEMIQELPVVRGDLKQDGLLPCL